MLLSGVYLLSIVLLNILFLLIKKSSKKYNLLMWILISLILLFCYNSFIVYVLSTINIKTTLLSLSIVNFVICIFFILYIIKNKSFQKYYIDKLDFLIVILFLIITILIGYFRFGFPLKIVYETSDSGTHFWKCMDFFRQTFLLNKASVTIDFSTRVFASYVNVGILFKVMSPIVGYIDLYKVYICYDLATFFLLGISFYFILRQICSNRDKFLISIASLLYLFGYPLNNLIFGFFYLGHVIILVSLLILILKKYNNEEFDAKYLIFFVTLINIGICFTYYLYVPIVFITEIIYFIYWFKNKQNLNNKIILKRLSIIIIIPIVFLTHYFFLPYIGTTQHNLISQLTLDGYFYNSWLSNFIVFLPFIIYFIIKNKNFEFEISLFILTLILIVGIAILSCFNVVVNYYSSKFFYLLWLLSFILIIEMFNLKSVSLLFKKIYCISFIILFLFSIFNIEDRLVDNEKLEVNKIESSNILDIYSFNFDKIKRPIITFTTEEIKIIKELYNLKAQNVINNFNLEFNQQRIWLDAFFWTSKMDYPENELYDYITNKEYYFDPLDEDSFYKISDDYNYYLILYRDIDSLKYKNYRGSVPFSIFSRWDKNYRKSYVISNKNLYDKIPRNTCINCTFIDFDDGMIIVKA